MSPEVTAQRMCEVLRLIDEALGCSHSVAEHERKWCMDRKLVKELEGENGPILTLTNDGMRMLDHWSRINSGKKDDQEE